jgi:hypothetical protein
MLFQKKFLMYCLLAVAALLVSSPVYALNCGDTVSGNVTLTANLNCSGPGLIVGASNTLIDLNGFTMSCTNAGGQYMGSCQNSTLTPAPPPLSVVGIKSLGFNNVSVRGPGTITGFGVGVELAAGTGLHVNGVTITGPKESVDFLPKRMNAVGVVVGQTKCSPPTLAPVWSATVEFNDISNHMMGVQLTNTSCVLVSGNTIHDNAGSYGDSHGIDVIGSSYNTISTNTVTRNGANLGIIGGVDGGIMLLNSATTGNQVVNNNVSGNCGDGITTRNGAQDNNIVLNVAVNNSVSTLGARYAFAPIGTFFDVAERNQGPGNIWNANNTCKSQSAGIPGGVCP